MSSRLSPVRTPTHAPAARSIATCWAFFRRVATCSGVMLSRSPFWSSPRYIGLSTPCQHPHPRVNVSGRQTQFAYLTRLAVDLAIVSLSRYPQRPNDFDACKTERMDTGAQGRKPENMADYKGTEYVGVLWVYPWYGQDTMELSIARRNSTRMQPFFTARERFN